MADDEATVRIGDRAIGAGHPTFVIAELSANHQHDISVALELIDVAADAGCDAVKFQTYTPDTLTIDADGEGFVVGADTLWGGRRLYDLYAEAMTPWEWHAELFGRALARGLIAFSTPFDASAVDFLVDLDAPAMKIASFELVDHGLIATAAATGRPLVMSTGMATVDEIDAAVAVARSNGAGGVILLRCNSAYPAPPGEMDLRTMPDMARRWNVPVGLSDHTLGIATSVAAVALGACVVEKHVTMSRSVPGPDAAFSLEPDELHELVAGIREVEAALGGVRYGPTERERPSLALRRSLYMVADVRAGDVLDRTTVRSIRPAGGLAPSELDAVIGCRATRDIARGTPLSWELVDRDG